MRNRVVAAVCGLLLVTACGAMAVASATAVDGPPDVSELCPADEICSDTVIVTPDPTDELSPELPDVCPLNDCKLVNE